MKNLFPDQPYTTLDDLDDLDWVTTSLAAYGTGPESFRAAFAALAGDFAPEGRLPIPLRTNQ